MVQAKARYCVTWPDFLFNVHLNLIDTVLNMLLCGCDSNGHFRRKIQIRFLLIFKSVIQKNHVLT
jgi:hypothetical protein